MNVVMFNAFTCYCQLVYVVHTNINTRDFTEYTLLLASIEYVYFEQMTVNSVL